MLIFGCAFWKHILQTTGLPSPVDFPVCLTSQSFDFPVLWLPSLFDFPVLWLPSLFDFPVLWLPSPLASQPVWLPSPLTSQSFGFPACLTFQSFGFPACLTSQSVDFPVCLTSPSGMATSRIQDREDAGSSEAFVVPEQFAWAGQGHSPTDCVNDVATSESCMWVWKKCCTVSTLNFLLISFDGLCAEAAGIA